MKRLESQRLTLKKLETKDADLIYALYNTKDFLLYIGDKKIDSLELARNYIQSPIQKMYKDHNVGMCLVERKSDQAKLGVCGLVKREGLDDFDIGFGFLPEFYGQGYAFEAAKATLNFAEKDLNLKKVVAITNQDNQPSIKLLSLSLIHI